MTLGLQLIQCVLDPLQVIHARPAIDSHGNHSTGLPVWAGATKAPFPNGEQCTLSDALVLSTAMAPSDLRSAVHVQIRPQWLQALAAHPTAFKIMSINGRVVGKRALPLAVAVPLVESLIPAAIERVRQEMDQLSASLAVWDQAVQAVQALQAAADGDGGDLEIVSDNDE
jgi:hypothetical protein